MTPGCCTIEFLFLIFPPFAARHNYAVRKQDSNSTQLQKKKDLPWMARIVLDLKMIAARQLKKAVA